MLGGSPIGLVRLSERATALFREDSRGTHLDVTDAATAALADRLLARNLAHPDLPGLPHVDPAQITVVVPVRDRVAQLDRCLSALRPLRCLVVDDASTDPEAVAAVVAAHGATSVRLRTNVGPAGARNAGLAEVTTPYVALVDSDVEVTSAALLDLSRHFADPSVALAAPRVVGVVRGSRGRWFQRYEAVNSSLDQGNRPVTVAHGACVAWLPSACLVGRTTALRAGFDPTLRVGEDVDLVWRTMAAGRRVRYAPEVVARHDVRGSLPAWLGRVVAYGTSGAPLAARHGDAVAPAAFTPLQGITGFAVLARSPLAVPLLAISAGVTFRRVRPALPAGAEGRRAAARLTVTGLASAVNQASALTLRHWWPLIAATLHTRTGRRTAASALLLDGALALRADPNHPVEPGTTSYAARWAGRRLTDLAYGTGLWWGAARERTPGSWRCLLPRFPERGTRSKDTEGRIRREPAPTVARES